MEEKRHPMNLQGLLRFALEHTKKEDAPSDSVFQEMDVEKRNFLENALKGMSIDVIEEFHKAITTLEDPSSATEEKLNALNAVREFIDNLDFANNFVKVGGTKVLIKYVNSEESALCVCATYTVAEMSQNNPFCQKHFVEEGLIPLFVAKFGSPNEDVANSSLHALSTLVRSFEPGLVEFLKIGGIVPLLSCLNSKHSRVFVKACFLIAHLSSSQALVRDEIIKKSAIPKLCEHLEAVGGFDIRTETVLSALAGLSTSAKFKDEIKNKDEVQSILNTIINENKALPQCEEIVEYAKIILQALEG